MEKYRLKYVEQPVMGIERLAEVARAIDPPVMADESAWNAHDVLQIIERRAAQMVRRLSAVIVEQHRLAEQFAHEDRRQRREQERGIRRRVRVYEVGAPQFAHRSKLIARLAAWRPALRAAR